jgi:hypothetical protein
MQNPLSRYACFLVFAVLLLFRMQHLHDHDNRTLNVTTWDAFGYYAYLPSAFIYHDVRELKWVENTDRKYNLTGGTLYQASQQKNGNYVFKYLGGVAILQLPFFLLGHLLAYITGAPADGFSWPYQYCLAFGAIIWVMLGVFLLRKILLRFFPDTTTALTILLVMLATNLIQYVAIDGAMSHAWIFPLYVFVLYTTIRWHEDHRRKWAILTGLVIGLATICRPTELVMLFIPLFWNTHTKEAARAKWAQVKMHRVQILLAAGGAFLGVLPQLLYWKYASGSFVYDVGSKWMFFNPWFRVLFGWEKGWFIYTPVALLLVAGLFFLKNLPFRKSIIIFCLLNIWIIISWSDWRYGASYSCRAMVQSSPVWALALAALIDRVKIKWQQVVFFLAGIYLTGVNLFQLQQYATTVLHYNDMNRKYYSKIYLDASPSAVEMSLLDTQDFLEDESDYASKVIFSLSKDTLSATEARSGIVASVPLETNSRWIKISCRIKAKAGQRTAHLKSDLTAKDSVVKSSRIRLYYPTSSESGWNEHVFYMEIPENSGVTALNLFLESFGEFEGEIRDLEVKCFFDKGPK